MANAVVSDWPSGVANTGWPSEPTAMLMPGRVQGWPAGTQRAANAAQRLLSQAVAWWDVEQYRDGDRFLRNRGTGGELLDLRLGSANVANSNEPLYLPSEDSGYVFLPGVSGNTLSVPDENALDITGDIDIRVRVALDDWTPANEQDFINKTATGQRSFIFSLEGNAAPKLNYYWTADGSTNRLIQSSVALSGVNDGAAKWVRVTHETTSGDVKFYTSDDGASWSQLGTTQSTTAGARHSGTANVRVSGGAGSTSGKIYRAQILDGINGTTVLDIDCDAITSGSATSFTALTNQTVTINRSTSGRKAVAVPSRHKGGRPVMLLGTDDYLEIPAENGWQHGLLNFGVGQSFTICIAARVWNTPASFQNYFSKSLGNGTLGYYLSASGSSLGILAELNMSAVGGGGGITIQTTQSLSSGAISSFGMVVERTTQRLFTFVNSALSTQIVSTSPVPNLSNSNVVSIGRASSGGLNADMELYGVSIFRRALSPAEITLLSNYFTGRIA